MATVTNAQLAAELAAFLERSDPRERELRDWQSGTPNGGENMDGQYPITSFDGETYLYKSPARLVAEVDDATNGALAHANVAEAAKVSAENALTATESARDFTITNKDATEDYKIVAEAAAVSAANYSANSLVYSNASQAAQTAAEAAEAVAVQAKDDALVSEGLATQKASEASTSASEAAASAALAATFDPNDYFTQTVADARFAPISHSHSISQVTGLQSALDGKSDDGHGHVIGDVSGLQSALDGKQIAGSYAASSHGHMIADVSGLQSALDGKQVAGSYASSSHSHVISDVTGLQSALDGKQAAGNYLPTSSGGALTANLLSPYQGRFGYGDGGGYVQLQGGGTSYTGYVGFYNSADVRQGYIGFGDGGNLDIYSEQGNYYNFNVTPRVNGVALATSVSTTLTGTTSLSKLRITNSNDASLSSTTHGLQIGPDNNTNIIADNNEIQARNNGGASPLYLNNDGGQVFTNGSLVWNTATFDPNDYVPKTGGIISGVIGRTAHNVGHLEGGYNNVGISSSHTSPIYTLGSSYRPNLTDLGNMYGVGFTYSNASFLSWTGIANKWGFYIAADGDARVFLDGTSGNIHTQGSIYSAGHVYSDGNFYGNGTDLVLTAANYGSYTVNKTSGVFTSSATAPVFQGTAVSNRSKFRVYSGSTYGIGMASGMTFGGLNDWAMTFQMNSSSTRGWWWGQDGHSAAQGIMALSNAGNLTVASRVRIGYGGSDTTTPTYPLEVNGNININDASTARLRLGGANGTKIGYIQTDSAGNMVLSAITSGAHYFDNNSGSLTVRDIDNSYAAVFAVTPSLLKHNGLGVPHHVTSGQTGSKITTSTSSPSGGENGDIWYKV